jgi:hypothetical protein
MRRIPSLISISAYAGGSLLGVVGFFWIYSSTYLTGEVPFFSPPSADVAQSLVGANYFLADYWHWLPLKVPNLESPEGLSIVYTDSIPLLALIVRLVMGQGIAPLNYFGFWILFCFALQGAGAVYLLRSFGERRFVVLLLGSVLLLLMVPFLARQGFGHLALCGHFLLLFALGLAVRVVRDGVWLPRAATFAALTAAAALVHPYLAAMVGGCCAIAALSIWVDRGRFWAAISGLIAAAGIMAVVALAAGFTDAASTRGGFGTYSLNLLGPFWPQQSGLFGANLPILDATRGQYEGYAYLGAGILLLVALSLAMLVARRREFWPRLQAGRVLILGMAVTYLFAASSVGYAGYVKLYDFSPAPSVFELFRASARFAWLPLYLGTAAAIITVARSLSRVAVLGILALAVAVQALDLAPLRLSVANHVTKPKEWLIDRPAWDMLLASHTNLRILPNYWCGMRSFEQPFLEITYLASRHNIPVNTVRSALEGSTASECISDISELQQLKLEPGHLVVIAGPALARVMLADLLQHHRECRAFFPGGYACTLAWDTLTDPVLAKTFKPDERLPVLSPYRAGSSISFAADGLGRDVLFYGWSLPEQSGTWSVGTRAALLIPIDTAPLPQSITLTMHAYGAMQRVRVRLGDGSEQELEVLGEPQRFTFALTPEAISNGALRVVFETPDARSPAAEGSSDSRILGVYLRSISLD